MGSPSTRQRHATVPRHIFPIQKSAAYGTKFYDGHFELSEAWIPYTFRNTAHKMDTAEIGFQLLSGLCEYTTETIVELRQRL